MTHSSRAFRAVIGLTSVIAAAGMMAHNVFEFGPWFLGSPETLIPLAIYGLLARSRSRGRTASSRWSRSSAGRS